MAREPLFDDELRGAIVVDLETKVDDAFIADPMVIERLQRSIEPPENYGPEAQAKFIATAWEKKKRKLALDPACARIVAVGLADISTDERPIVMGADNEASLLEHAIDEIRRLGPVLFCGFNVRHFDMPMLWTRAMIHGLRVPWWWPQQPLRDYRSIVDARDQLGREYSLAFWLARFGLPGKTSDGAAVDGMTIEETVEYCENDCVVERLLMQRLARGFPALMRCMKDKVLEGLTSGS